MVTFNSCMAVGGPCSALVRFFFFFFFTAFMFGCSESLVSTGCAFHSHLLAILKST